MAVPVVPVSSAMPNACSGLRMVVKEGLLVQGRRTGFARWRWVAILSASSVHQRATPATADGSTKHFSLCSRAWLNAFALHTQRPVPTVVYSSMSAEMDSGDMAYPTMVVDTTSPARRISKKSSQHRFQTAQS